MSYRYLRADCHRPPAQLLHVDLLLRFFEDCVEGEETLLLEMREPGDSLTLDAAALQVGPAFLLGEDGGEEPLSTLYDKEANRLTLALPHRVAAGGRLRVRLSAVSRPSESLLEGIYRDTTPAGAPPQFISQCQQWGFQRIMPIPDDCTAKCTWRTTLEGDARYTHLISNGDVDRTENPSGVPVRIPGEPQRQRITYVNPIPMPPYLFIAAAGTWDVLADEVTTPGGRRVRLEYLVPPGQVEGARIPMQILKDSILWQARHVGYEYCRECYRTICMEKSNFGGMENVGNTTIITEAALLDRWTTDRRLVYAYGVIVHEYEHNHCGSDVTMETPFDMWLNEAYTVTVEQAYLAARFGADAARLDELDGLRDPLRGPLSAEDAGAAAPIVREGFDHPDDVVDGVTYQKAPEVLGMLRRLLGDARYRQATGTYFATYNGGNATTEQFLDAFRAVAPDPALLDRFFSGWLFTAGYPVLTGSWRYDAATRVLTLSLQQRGNVDGIGPFVIPFRVRACAGGAVLPGTERLLVLDGAEQTWKIPGVATAPDFIDWNGGLPFYGKFRETSATPAAGELAARFHPSLTGRAEAFSALTEQAVLREMGELPGSNEAWMRLFRDVLLGADIPDDAVCARMLTLSEDLQDVRALTKPLERATAVAALRRAVARTCPDALRTRWLSACAAIPADPPRDAEALSRVIPQRALARALGALYACSGDARAVADFTARFDAARCASEYADAVLGVAAAGDRAQTRALLARFRAAAVGHVAGYGAYLAALGSLPLPEVFDWAEAEERTDAFLPEHPGHARALHGALARNNTRLWTPRGLAWLESALLRMAPVNENVPILVMGALQNARNFPDGYRDAALGLLQRVQAALPSVAPGAHALASRLRAALRAGP